MSFFEIWSELKDKGDHLKLKPSDLKRLLSDNEVRAELQGGRVASLLPPVGTEVFRRLTSASLQEAQHPHEDQASKRPQRTKSKKEVNGLQSKPSSYLEAGERTPFFYGDPPPDLLYRGLEELDPFYQSEKTFLVLSQGNILHRFDSGSSCNLLSPYDCLRTMSIKILLHPLFRWLILFTLLLNCVFMTLTHSPIMECVFISVYIFEVLIKVSARGFCVGRFTFIKDPWNWLDPLVIMSALLSEFVVHLEGLSLLASIPRILKIISASPGLRKTVKSLVQSTRRLISAIILTVFVMSVLAAIAVHLFMGTLHHKCVSKQTSNDTGYNDVTIYLSNSGDFNYSDHILNKENYFYLPGKLDALVCGNSSTAGRCPEGFVCLTAGRNPNYGYTGYDSFGLSLLSISRLVTQDFVENLIQLTLTSAGKSSVLPFVLFLLPACFMLVSLMLAAVVMAFVDHKKTETSKRKRKEEDFRHIEEVLRRREREEPEEGSSRAAPSENRQERDKGDSLAEAEGDQRPSSWWLRLRLWLQPFVLSPYFDLIIVLCLITNIIFTAMEHFPMTMTFDIMMGIANLVFLSIYVLEMILRMLALGVRGYFQVRWHIFDFLLVVDGFVTLGLADVEGMLGVGWAELRVLRLARWWPLFHLFLRHVWSSVQRVTVILLVFIFMFVVVGLLLFQTDYSSEVCKISPDCQLPRWHMHDFFHTFMLVCRILMGEWVELIWDCMEVSGQGICVVYFGTVLIIGRLLILVLFLKLLLNSDIGDKLASVEESRRLHTSMKQIRTWIQTCRWKRQKDQMDPDPKEADSGKDERKEYVSLTLVTSGGSQDSRTGKKQNLDSCQDLSPESEVMTGEEDKKSIQCDVEQKPNEEHQKENTPEDCCCTCCYSCCPFQDAGSGPTWSNFRRTCLRVVENRLFEGFMFFIIMLSCAALMFEDIHLDQDPVLQTVLDYGDWIFSLIFLLEMLIKWAAFGFKKYFSSFYCWLDFLILAVALFSPVLQLSGVSSRPLRALRTLRTPSRIKGVRVVLRALAVTLPSLLGVLLVGFSVWLIFAMIGVSLFAGKFYYCFNETSEELFRFEEVNNDSDCLSLMEDNFEVRWKNSEFNFDNVIMSYMSLFITALSTGYYSIIYSAMDSRQVFMQPEYEFNVYRYLFFLYFFIIGCFFTFSFFIKVFVHKLHQERHQFGGNHLFITEEQKIYTRGLKKRFTSKPTNDFPPPQNRCQAWLFNLVTSRYYEIFMMVVICLNLVTCMLETFDDSTEKLTVLNYLYFVFVLIFFCEFFLKIVALRQFYFSCRLNVLDLIVLLFSIAGLFFSDLLEKYVFGSTIYLFLRLARLGRVLRSFRCFQGIWTLLLGFMMSLPALINIGLLFFIMLFFFSAVGMMNFGFAKKEHMISDMYNFETFWNSLISMILVTPSTAWNGMLIPIMRKDPDCDPFKENPGFSVIGDCSSPALGIIFFTSYIVLFFLLRVLLFVAVILETFNARESKCIEDFQQLSDQHLQMFCKTWKKFDSKDSQAIQHSELSDFCDALQDPLRIPKPNGTKLANMDLPLLPGDQICCVDVLQALTAQAFGESVQDETLKSRLEETFNKLPKVSEEPISTTSQT